MRFTRRDTLKLGLKGGAALGACLAAPSIVLAQGRRPMLPYGVMSGDMLHDLSLIHI